MTDQLEHVLIEKIRGGNHSGCKYLIDKYKRMVYSVVYQILREEQEAEEVVHDVFLKAFHKLSDFRGTGKFSTWLYRIAYHEALGKLRKKRIPTTHWEESKETIHPVSDYEDGFEQLVARDQSECLQHALQLLSEEERVLITMYYYEELSQAEMEEVTGIKRNQIKIKIHRARKKLLHHISTYLREETEVLL